MALMQAAIAHYCANVAGLTPSDPLEQAKVGLRASILALAGKLVLPNSVRMAAWHGPPLLSQGRILVCVAPDLLCRTRALVCR